MAKAQNNEQPPPTQSDLDEVMAQLAALREDMALLAQSISGTATKREGTFTADFAEGFEAAKQYVESTGKSAERQLQGSVAANPLLALALAAGAGFLVGAIVRR